MYTRITKLMQLMPGDSYIHIMLMQNYIYQKKYHEVVNMTGTYLNDCTESESSMLLYLRATALYYLNDVTQSINTCRNLLQRDPDFRYAQQLIKRIRKISTEKEEVKSVFASKQYKEAITRYQHLASLDVFNDIYNSIIFNNIAACYMSLSDHENALRFANKSISYVRTSSVFMN